MQVKKQQLELDMGKQTGSNSGKEIVKAVYCHPAYLNYAEYNMQNAGLDEAQAGIMIARRNISNLKHADDTTLMVESKEELKCLLISWLQLPTAVVLEPKKIKSVTVSIISPPICHEVMGPDAMILVF